MLPNLKHALNISEYQVCLIILSQGCVKIEQNTDSSNRKAYLSVTCHEFWSPCGITQKTLSPNRELSLNHLNEKMEIWSLVPFLPLTYWATWDTLLTISASASPSIKENSLLSASIYIHIINGEYREMYDLLWRKCFRHLWTIPFNKSERVLSSNNWPPVAWHNEGVSKTQTKKKITLKRFCLHSIYLLCWRVCLNLLPIGSVLLLKNKFYFGIQLTYCTCLKCNVC